MVYQDRHIRVSRLHQAHAHDTADRKILFLFPRDLFHPPQQLVQTVLQAINRLIFQKQCELISFNSGKALPAAGKMIEQRTDAHQNIIPRLVAVIGINHLEIFDIHGNNRL